jgi:hypothetical protein
MAQAYKVLEQLAPDAASDSTLYTVPASTETIISTLFVANRGSTSATFRVAIRPGGASLVDKNYIAYDVPVAGNDTTTITAGITLSAGDVITVRASTADLSFNLSGTELS